MCLKCNGRTKVFTRDLVYPVYIETLNQALTTLHQETMTERGLIIFEGREMTPAQRDAELALRVAQADAARAEQERKLAEDRKAQAELAAATAEREKQWTETKRAIEVRRQQLEAERREQERQRHEEEERLRLQKEQEAAAKAAADRLAQRRRDTARTMEGIVTSVVLTILVITGFAGALKIGSKVARTETVPFRTALLTSVTVLVALTIILVCCLPLLQYALIVSLAIGVPTTAFTVKAMFRTTWDKAVLTTMFSTVVTTVFVAGLALTIGMLHLSCTMVDLVTQKASLKQPPTKLEDYHLQR
jgi:hypothetical protein